MTPEIRALALSALLSLALALGTVAIHLARFGGRTIRSNRANYPPLDGAAGRIVRAHANLTEALVPFAIVVLAARSLGVSNAWTIAAADAFLAARFAHAALYVGGVPEVRSMAFYVGLLATAVFALQLRLIAR